MGWNSCTWPGSRQRSPQGRGHPCPSVQEERRAQTPALPRRLCSPGQCLPPRSTEPFPMESKCFPLGCSPAMGPAYPRPKCHLTGELGKSLVCQAAVAKPFPGAATALPNYFRSLSQAELSGREEKGDFSIYQRSILVFHWYQTAEKSLFAR